MSTPIWQILAKLDRIHELQVQMSPMHLAPPSSGSDGGSDDANTLRDPSIQQLPAGGDVTGESRFDRATRPPKRRLFPSKAQLASATLDVAESMGAQRVPVNVYEASGAIVVVAPLPAVTADDVSIELQQGGLHFHADLRNAAPRPYLVHEWEYGGFEGSVELPEGFGSSIEATLANGQLVIRVLRGKFTGPMSIHPVSIGKRNPARIQPNDIRDSEMHYRSAV